MWFDAAAGTRHIISFFKPRLALSPNLNLTVATTLAFVIDRQTLQLRLDLTETGVQAKQAWR